MKDRSDGRVLTDMRFRGADAAFEGMHRGAHGEFQLGKSTGGECCTHTQTAEANAESLVEKLGEAGCEDALVGVGQPGRVTLDFTREAKSASEAVLSAIKNVRRAIPDAQLIEASPDYVGLTDVAEMVGVSRQNMRKLMASHLDFPSPVHEGSSQIWHLELVLRWMSGRTGLHRIEQRLMEIAQVTMQVNLTNEAKRLEPAQQERFRKWLAA